MKPRVGPPAGWYGRRAGPPLAPAAADRANKVSWRGRLLLSLKYTQVQDAIVSVG